MNIKAPVVAIATVLTLFITSASIGSSTVFAQQSQNAHFIAMLSGKSAIPPNLTTNATGKASFTVTDAGKRMSYSVNAMKINHVDNVVLVLYTRGHGNPASNVVLLRLGSQHGATGPINGVLVQGSIKSSDLVGPLKGKQISNLVRDMLDGKIDLWVTTTQLLMIAGKVIPATAAPSANATAAPSANATAAPSANATAAPSANATAAPSANA
ncbi:MAG: CHRD domain-containing protein, partial [Candidatus Nitrosopolaris sp.]